MFPALVLRHIWVWRASALTGLLLVIGIWEGFVLTQESILIQLGRRWAEGEVPYRDFAWTRTPYTIWWHMLAIKVFGLEGIVLKLRIIWLVFMMLSAAAVAASLAGVVGRTWATAYAVLGVTWTAVSVHTPWYTTDGAMWSLFAVVAMVHLGTRPAAAPVVGFFCAMAGLAKQNFLLVAIVFLTIVVLRARLVRGSRDAAQAGLLFLIGFALPVLAFAGYLRAHGSLGPALAFMFLNDVELPGGTLRYLLAEWFGSFALFPLSIVALALGVWLAHGAVSGWLPRRLARVPVPGIALVLVAVLAAAAVAIGLAVVGHPHPWRMLTASLITATLGFHAAYLLLGGYRSRDAFAAWLDDPRTVLAVGGLVIVGVASVSYASFLSGREALMAGLPAAFALMHDPAAARTEHGDFDRRLVDRPIAMAMGIALIIAVAGTLLVPYKTSSIFLEDQVPLGDGVLAGLYGTREEALFLERIRTMGRCADAYAPAFFVLNHPHVVHLLSETKNPTSVDIWIFSDYDIAQVQELDGLMDAGAHVMLHDGYSAKATVDADGAIVARNQEPNLQGVIDRITQEYTGIEVMPGTVYALPKADTERHGQVAACLGSAPEDPLWIDRI